MLLRRIDPKTLRPVRAGLRYLLPHWSLGRLESLSRSRFAITEELPDSEKKELTKWHTREHLFYNTIVQSVYASCAIEGESVYVPGAEVRGGHEEEAVGISVAERQKREEAGNAAYDAHIFALQHTGFPVLSVPLIMEIHKRLMTPYMGVELAGRYKSEDVVLKGGDYIIETVTHERAPEFLASVVESLNKRWEQALSTGEYSLFLTIAEFLVDFLAIHPFGDGNGRTARILSTYLLERAGYHFARFYSLDNLIHEQRSAYYAALYSAQANWFGEKEDLTDWIVFYIDIVHSQFKRALEAIRDQARKASLGR